MMPVIVLRPEPGCAATLAAARARGLDAQGYPLFEVRSCEWDAPAPDAFDALLLGSANGLRHAGPALAAYAGKPAWCVGEATAQAAQAAGLRVCAAGSGGLQPVLDRVDPAHRRLLRLCGAERIALAPPPGIELIERVIYESAALPIPDPLAARLADGAVILLHSGEAASHFARECERLGIAKARLHLAALGPRIAAAAGDGWASLAHTASPDDAALLALAGELCQSRA